MKTAFIIWGAAIIYCIIEAIFFSELDPESKEYLKNRENKLKIKKHGKSKNLYTRKLQIL